MLRDENSTALATVQKQFYNRLAYSELATDKLDTPIFVVDWFEEVNQLLCRGDVEQYPLLYSPPQKKEKKYNL